MKTNTKNTLKKLGLGATAFACLMSTGMPVSAAEKTGNTTVIYDNRNIIEGEAGDDNIVKWGVVIPTTITLDNETVGVTNEIEVVGMNNYDLDSTYTVLTIKASVQSANGYKLESSSASTVGEYTLQANGNDYAFTADKNKQEFVTRLGVGTNSGSKNNEKSVTLISKVTNSSSLKQGEYKDTLTFTFEQLEANEKS